MYPCSFINGNKCTTLTPDVNNRGRGGVKMAVWEDTELVSPHNWGACQPLVGDSDTQGDGRNPKVNR